MDGFFGVCEDECVAEIAPDVDLTPLDEPEPRLACDEALKPAVPLHQEDGPSPTGIEDVPDRFQDKRELPSDVPPAPLPEGGICNDPINRSLWDRSAIARVLAVVVPAGCESRRVQVADDAPPHEVGPGLHHSPRAHASSN